MKKPGELKKGGGRVSFAQKNRGTEERTKPRQQRAMLISESAEQMPRFTQTKWSEIHQPNFGLDQEKIIQRSYKEG